MILLNDSGCSAEIIAYRLGMHSNTIYKWLKSFQFNGIEGLYDCEGRGRKPILSAEESKVACEIVEKDPRRIDEHLPEIEKKTGKSVSKSTLKRILKAAGYRWGRMRKSLKGKRNEVKFRKAQEELEELKAMEDKDLIEIIYCDEVGFSTVPLIPYVWQKKGEQLKLPTAPSKRYNVFGFMKRDNAVQAYGFQSNINSNALITCMDSFCQQRLEDPQSQNTKAVIIMDNASVHNSDEFRNKEKEWEKQGVTIKRIPPYSPELNLIEILWRKIKYDWLPLDAYVEYETMCNKVDDVIRNVGKKFTINFG